MGFLASLFALTPAADRIENQYGLGLLYGLRGPIAPPAGAVIVAIDNATIAWLRNSWAEPDSHPWLSCMPPAERPQLAHVRGPNSLPRSFQACLLNRLKDAGFPVVAFDILFSVPGPEQDDAAFADALKGHGAAVILTGLERATVRDGATELLVEREVPPLPLFQQSAAATGIFLVPRSGGPVYGYLKRARGFESTPSLPDEVQKLLTQRVGAGSPPVSRNAFEYLLLYGPPGSIFHGFARDILSGES